MGLLHVVAVLVLRSDVAQGTFGTRASELEPATAVHSVLCAVSANQVREGNCLLTLQAVHRDQHPPNPSKPGIHEFLCAIV